MMFDCYRVMIEFKRIQTYLCAVSRLRTILGANALIGEVLRIDLPEKARKSEWRLPDGIRLPKTILEYSKVDGDPLAPSAVEELEKAEPDWTKDSPRSAYFHGVLARDGGHFQALFAENGAAQAFFEKAERHIKTNLPGLLFDIRFERWHPQTTDKSLAAGWKAIEKSASNSLQAVTEKPGQAVCQWSGQGPATKTIHVGGQTLRVSKLVKHQWVRGSAFRKGKTRDIIGLLRMRETLPCFGKEWTDPEDLADLAGGEGRYLALLHIDGNGVGKRKPEGRAAAIGNDETPVQAFQRWFDIEAAIECFFHSMRAQVRAALIEALQHTFGALSPAKNATRPYELLMVGGDDLLLLTRAEFALGFLCHYAEALTTRKLSDRNPLDVGAGVVIAKPTFPFHKLHELVEALASSAKRLSRCHPGRSVADWMIVTASDVTDIEQHRRTHDLLRYRIDANSLETLALSAKPYFILNRQPSNDSKPSDAEEPLPLSSLLDLADALRAKQSRVARSQLKALPDLLRRGRRAGEEAVRELPDDLREKLNNYGLACAWQVHREETRNGKKHWLGISRLGDLVEIAEIPELGRRGGASDAREPETGTATEGRAKA